MKLYETRNYWLAWTWELPQTLCAMVMKYIYNSKSTRLDYETLDIVGTEVKFSPVQGVCVLGEWMFVPRNRMLPIPSFFNALGHRSQSRILGWFYFPIVGLPLLVRVLWDRLFHSKWDYGARVHWFFSGYSVRWADRLGGVERR